MNTVFKILLCMLLLFQSELQAQGQELMVTPQVIAATGNHVTVNSTELSWVAGEPIITTLETGNYILTQGFLQSEDVFFNANRPSDQLRIVITPNGDKLNDALVFESLRNYPENEIKIFNRWGSIVFEADPYLNDWSGQSPNGNLLPEGTYFFILKLEPRANKHLSGSVTITK